HAKRPCPLLLAPAAVAGGAPRVRAPPRGPARTADRHPRIRAPRHELARGVPLSSPVSVRLGPLPHRGAPAAGGPRARPVGSLLAGGRAGAPEGDVSDLV